VVFDLAAPGLGLITLRAIGLFIRQGKPGAFPDEPVEKDHSKEIA
jgi:hypothetical protein